MLLVVLTICGLLTTLGLVALALWPGPAGWGWGPRPASPQLGWRRRPLMLRPLWGARRMGWRRRARRW